MKTEVVTFDAMILAEPITDAKGNASRAFKAPEYTIAFLVDFGLVELSAGKWVRVVPIGSMREATPERVKEEPPPPPGHKSIIVPGGKLQ